MSLFKQIIAGIPDSVTIPNEMEAVVDWYEGSDDLIGGLFEFYADEDRDMVENWFGKPNLTKRFGVFGILPDGSPVAFWINDNDEQKIIMLGSEGEGQLILADNFKDFVRLVAIGYDEFLYTDFDQTIQEHNEENEEAPLHGVNAYFQEWFTKKFRTSIPSNGSEIIDTQDETFGIWVDKQLNS